MLEVLILLFLASSVKSCGPLHDNSRTYDEPSQPALNNNEEPEPEESEELVPGESEEPVHGDSDNEEQPKPDTDERPEQEYELRQIQITVDEPGLVIFSHILYMPGVLQLSNNARPNKDGYVKIILNERMAYCYKREKKTREFILSHKTLYQDRKCENTLNDTVPVLGEEPGIQEVRAEREDKALSKHAIIYLDVIIIK